MVSRRRSGRVRHQPGDGAFADKTAADETGTEFAQLLRARQSLLSCMCILVCILCSRTATLADAGRSRAGGIDRTAEPAPRTPDDPLFRQSQGYLLAVNALAAWSTQTGDSSIVVALLDDGIDVTHPDLAANIWLNPQVGNGDCGVDLHGCNLLDPLTSAATCGAGSAPRTPDISPTGWRGTFLAGIIGAAGNNGQGIAGAVWNVSLMAVRVADCHGRADAAAVANGIHYAVDHGARLIDVGVTSSRVAGGTCRAPGRFAGDAVQYARDHGVLVIAGSGDTGKGCVADPGAAPGALAVGGASFPSGVRWTTSRTGAASNWGPEVAVAAPANAVIGTIPQRPDQRPPNDLYRIDSTTAAAAAIVTGEAALLLSQNQLLTPDWLSTLIALGAHPLADGDTPGWAGAGLVDFAASLRLVPAGFSGSLTVDGVPAPDGTRIEGYLDGVLCAQAASFALNGASGYALFVPVAQMQAGCGVPGVTVDLRVNGLPVASVPWMAAAIALDLVAGAAP